MQTLAPIDARIKWCIKNFVDEFSARIKELREYAQLERDEFAAIAGISAGSLRNIESGQRRPGLDVVVALGHHWPEFSLWLAYGRTHAEAGQTSPAIERARMDSAREGARG